MKHDHAHEIRRTFIQAQSPRRNPHTRLVLLIGVLLAAVAWGIAR